MYLTAVVEAPPQTVYNVGKYHQFRSADLKYQHTIITRNQTRRVSLTETNDNNTVNRVRTELACMPQNAFNG